MRNEMRLAGGKYAQAVRPTAQITARAEAHRWGGAAGQGSGGAVGRWSGRMSSVWSRLEALRASQLRRGRSSVPSASQRCPCGQCGWTAAPGGGQQSPGFPDSLGLRGILDILAHQLPKEAVENAHLVDNPDYVRGKFRTDIVMVVEIYRGFMDPRSAYRIPQDGAEEERVFAKELEGLMQRLVQCSTHPHSTWPDLLAMMRDGALATDAWTLEKLVRHHDPRLQLIHLPSFRCFVELQYLRRYVDHCIRQVAGLGHRAKLEPPDEKTTGALTRLLQSIYSITECIVFYAGKLGLDIPRELVCHCAHFEHSLIQSYQPAPTLWRKPRQEQAASAAAAETAAQPSAALEEPSPAPPKERLSKGQRKRRAKAAAKASQAPARPRSLSADPSELPAGESEEEAWARADSGQPDCPSLEALTSGSAVETAGSLGPMRSWEGPTRPVAVEPRSSEWSVCAHAHARLLRRLRATPLR